MTSLRTLALEGADGVALAFQSAFQYFGFLSANRESAIERDAESFRLAVLPGGVRRIDGLIDGHRVVAVRRGRTAGLLVPGARRQQHDHQHQGYSFARTKNMHDGSLSQELNTPVIMQAGRIPGK